MVDLLRDSPSGKALRGRGEAVKEDVALEMAFPSRTRAVSAVHRELLRNAAADGLQAAAEEECRDWRDV